MIPNQRFLDYLFPWQIRALEAFDQGGKRRFWHRCHRRSRKTTLAINLLIRECCTYEKSVYEYIGPTYKQAKKIVWRDPKMLFSYLPDKEEFGWEKNESELFIRFENESILQLLGGDDPDSLRGPEKRGIVFDEWALMKPELWTEIVYPIFAQGGDDRWAMFCYTPKGQNHAWQQEQKIKDDKAWHREVVKASQSGILPANKLIEAQQEMPPHLYDQELECSYITQEEMVLITSALLEILKGGHKKQFETRRIITIDPATTGDECIIYALENCGILEMERLHTHNVIDIGSKSAALGIKHGTEDFICDGIGLGTGTVNQLQLLGKNVIDFQSAATAHDEDKFANARAEAWYYTYERIRDREVPYPEDIELRRQLAAVRYGVKPPSDRLIMEKKEKVKARLGCSPDRADAYVMGVWGSQYVTPVEQRGERYDPADFSVDPMAV